MVTSIARQSIIIKCSMQKARILGNYEFYYAAGLAAKLFGIEISEEALPVELAGVIAERLSDVSPEDEKEKYLVWMLGEYAPGGDYDGQMKELLLWGKGEEYLWQTVIPAQRL